MYTHITESLCCIHETNNTITQLYFNKKRKKENIGDHKGPFFYPFIHSTVTEPPLTIRLISRKSKQKNWKHSGPHEPVVWGWGRGESQKTNKTSKNIIHQRVVCTVEEKGRVNPPRAGVTALQRMVAVSLSGQEKTGQWSAGKQGKHACSGRNSAPGKSNSRCRWGCSRGSREAGVADKPAKAKAAETKSETQAGGRLGLAGPLSHWKVFRWRAPGLTHTWTSVLWLLCSEQTRGGGGWRPAGQLQGVAAVHGEMTWWDCSPS